MNSLTDKARIDTPAAAPAVSPHLTVWGLPCLFGGSHDSEAPLCGRALFFSKPRAQRGCDRCIGKYRKALEQGRADFDQDHKAAAARKPAAWVCPAFRGIETYMGRTFHEIPIYELGESFVEGGGPPFLWLAVCQLFAEPPQTYSSRKPWPAMIVWSTPNAAQTACTRCPLEDKTRCAGVGAGPLFELHNSEDDEALQNGGFEVYVPPCGCQATVGMKAVTAWAYRTPQEALDRCKRCSKVQDDHKVTCGYYPNDLAPVPFRTEEDIGVYPSLACEPNQEETKPTSP